MDQQIIQGNKFDWNNFTFGMQRVLWGMMKKLIVSERLAIVVNTILGDYDSYRGIYIWIAFFLFVLQLYTDFSACIDIALGVSEMFGIKLPENFDLPFLSTSYSEFWRRWHITLGGALREYLFYPLLKSNAWQKIGAKTRQWFGKKIGKKIPVWIALFISWFTIGAWHGGTWNYIFGVGIFPWIVIVSGDILEPCFKWIIKKLSINTQTFSWKLFQCVRTFIIFMISDSFFRASSLTEGLRFWQSAFSEFNPWILVDESLFQLGLNRKNWNVVIFFMLLIVIQGILKAVKGISLREFVSQQNIVFRWILYLGLVFSVIIFGCYGPGYNLADFIYQGF